MSTCAITYRIVRDPDPMPPAESGDDALFIAAAHRQFYVMPGRVALPGREGRYRTLDEVQVAFRKTHWRFDLYAYIHSGIQVSLKPFSCPWDSCQVGYVYVSKAEWPKQEDAERTAQSHVDEWNQYLSGDIWGYVLIEDGEEIESCWGFYGRDVAKEQAEASMAHAIERRRQAEEMMTC